MAFEPLVLDSRRLRAVVVLMALALCGLAVALSQSTDSPRLLLIEGLLAAALALVAWRALRRLSVFPAQPMPDPGFGQPPDMLASRKALMALEAQLEFAPVALWRISATEVQALNVAARRLLAPGAALDPQALLQQLQDVPVGQRSMIAYESERGHERALVASAALQLGGVTSRVLALMSIESELETQTLQAWRQLVHVLTHEIMNSLTPIASLSVTALELLAQEADSTPLREHDDLAMALNTIARRAQHLVEFVGSYRSVSQWPPPSLQVVPLANLLTAVEQLVRPDWSARGGQVTVMLDPPNLDFMTDPAQLEQVLINLAKNALQACGRTDAPRLDISARLVRGGRLAIEVADNGPGVPNGLEARIFTPFFTTREQGSGIGLAVVRNLVHGMGGTVRYVKRPSGGACFVLTF